MNSRGPWDLTNAFANKFCSSLSSIVEGQIWSDCVRSNTDWLFAFFSFSVYDVHDHFAFISSRLSLFINYPLCRKSFFFSLPITWSPSRYNHFFVNWFYEVSPKIDERELIFQLIPFDNHHHHRSLSEKRCSVHFWWVVKEASL